MTERPPPSRKVARSRGRVLTRVPPFHRAFSTPRSHGGNEWSWGGDDAFGKPSASATRVAPGGLESLGGLSINGSSHPGDAPGPGRQAGGSNRRGTIIRGPAASSKTARPASLTGAAHAVPASYGHAASGAVHVRSLSLEIDPAFDPARFSDGERSDDGDLDEGSDTDDGFVPHTHDVIISEIEDINLADYMRTLEAPVFDEEAALADAFFGFGAGAFLRGKETASVPGGAVSDTANGVSSKSTHAAFAERMDDETTGESARETRDATAVSAVSSSAGAPRGPPPSSFSAAATSVFETDADGDGAFAFPPSALPPKPETPGRAGRRGWSRQGSRGGQGGQAGAEPAGGAAERPQTGGLDDADCAPGGLDGDAPLDADGEFAGINADIYDDSDDESWGEQTLSTRPSRAEGTEEEEDGGGGRASGTDAGGAFSSTKSPDADASAPGSGTNESTRVVGGSGGWSDTDTAAAAVTYGFDGTAGDQKAGPEADAPSRVRRRPVDDDFVVMSTPKGLRRVPSARKIRSAQGARPGAPPNGDASRSDGAHLGGVGGVGGAPGSKESFGGGAARRGRASDETAAAGARRQKPTRASSASGARASIETARRVEMLQRPPSRQRPPPEAVDLFARGRAAAAAAAAAPAVPGLSKVSRPAGMAASMLRA